jgi:hypothetical protein
MRPHELLTARASIAPAAAQDKMHKGGGVASLRGMHKQGHPVYICLQVRECWQQQTGQAGEEDFWSA